MNKKADVFQMLFLIVILFIVAFVGILFLTLSWNVQDFFDTSGLLGQNTTAQEANMILKQSGPNTTDYMVFFLFIAMNIGLVVSAARTNFSPMIVFLFILLTLIAVFVAAGFVNIYHGFSGAPLINDVSGKLVLTNLIFSRFFPLIVCALSALIMMIMYGKSGSDIVT
jgi:ammonia channel protein AmtB